MTTQQKTLQKVVPHTELEAASMEGWVVVESWVCTVTQEYDGIDSVYRSDTVMFLVEMDEESAIRQAHAAKDAALLEAAKAKADTEAANGKVTAAEEALGKLRGQLNAVVEQRCRIEERLRAFVAERGSDLFHIGREVSEILGDE